MTLVSGTANDDIVSPPSSMAKTSRASAMNTPTGMAKITMTRTGASTPFNQGVICFIISARKAPHA